MASRQYGFEYVLWGDRFLKKSAYICDIERVFDPYGSEYDGWVHQIVKICGHNSRLDKRKDAHAKGSYWGGWDTCGFAQALGELVRHSVGTPVNKTGWLELVVGPIATKSKQTAVKIVSWRIATCWRFNKLIKRGYHQRPISTMKSAKNIYVYVYIFF